MGNINLDAMSLLTNNNDDILLKHPALGSREARTMLGKIVRAAREDRHKIVITEHGEPAAAVVSINDLRILDWIRRIHLDDKILSAAAQEITIEELVGLLTNGVSIHEPDKSVHKTRKIDQVATEPELAGEARVYGNRRHDESQTEEITG
jgi:prevent-host-death family protein